jgi:hypothetical protein
MEEGRFSSRSRSRSARRFRRRRRRKSSRRPTRLSPSPWGHRSPVIPTRWPTLDHHQPLVDDEDRERLLSLLIEKGQEELVKALQNEKETGFIRVTGRGAGLTRFPSERLKFARAWDLGEGKRRLVLAMDRPIGFYEAMNQPRWRDYDMTLIVMDVDAEGNGEGQLPMGVRLGVDTEKKTLVVENFGTEPVRLTKIRRMK